MKCVIITDNRLIPQQFLEDEWEIKVFPKSWVRECPDTLEGFVKGLEGSPTPCLLSVEDIIEYAPDLVWFLTPGEHSLATKLKEHSLKVIGSGGVTDALAFSQDLKQNLGAKALDLTAHYTDEELMLKLLAKDLTIGSWYLANCEVPPEEALKMRGEIVNTFFDGYDERPGSYLEYRMWTHDPMVDLDTTFVSVLSGGVEVFTSEPIDHRKDFNGNEVVKSTPGPSRPLPKAEMLTALGYSGGLVTHWREGVLMSVSPIKSVAVWYAVKQRLQQSFLKMLYTCAKLGSFECEKSPEGVRVEFDPSERNTPLTVNPLLSFLDIGILSQFKKKLVGAI